MIGLIGYVATIYIFYLFWKNGKIKLKWKILFSIVALSVLHLFPIGLYITAIIVYFILKWQGVTIR